VFLTAAGVGAALRLYVGALSDRRGRTYPLRLALTGVTPILCAIPWVTNQWLLAALVVVALFQCWIMNSPAMALVADEWENAGVPQGAGWGLIFIAYG